MLLHVEEDVEAQLDQAGSHISDLKLEMVSPKMVLL